MMCSYFFNKFKQLKNELNDYELDKFNGFLTKADFKDATSRKTKAILYSPIIIVYVKKILVDIV